jgi:hypothetical protein
LTPPKEETVKDFDAERHAHMLTADARTFTIGGETFTYRASVRPEVLFEIAELDTDRPTGEVFAVMDRMIVNMLEPGESGDAGERWFALRQRDDDPITIDDLNALVEWLVEAQAGRPTQPPSSSSPSQEANGTPSTASSSSAAAAAYGD